MTDSAPAPAATPQAATPSAPGITWLPGADETTVGYVQNKGWDNPGKAVEGYRNLEKLLGADRAGRTVVIPGDGAEKSEWEGYFSKLGRPAEASGYELEVPNGQNGEFAQTAAKWLHEAGVSKKAGQAIAKAWNMHSEALAQAQLEADTARAQQEAAELNKTWGAAYDQNLSIAQNTRTSLGITDEEVDGLAGVIGLKRTIELFHSIGSRTGEPDFARGVGADNGGIMTPGQAKARIEELRTDPDFRKKYVSGSKEAVTEMTRLHALAYPEQKK